MYSKQYSNFLRRLCSYTLVLSTDNPTHEAKNLQLSLYPYLSNSWPRTIAKVVQNIHLRKLNINPVSVVATITLSMHRHSSYQSASTPPMVMLLTKAAATSTPAVMIISSMIR